MAYGAVEEHIAQAPALGQRRAEVQRSRPPKPAGPVRRQAGAHVTPGGGEVAQAEADGQAVARRPDRRRLRCSCNRVAAFAREGKAARHREQQTCGRGAFAPLAFLAGEAFPFDGSEDWAIIAGERTKL